MKRIFVTQDMFYNFGKDESFIREYIHDVVLEFIAFSYLNESNWDGDLVFIFEQRYANTDMRGFQTLDEMISKHKINMKKALVFVYSLYEPRAAIYSGASRYVNLKYNTPNDQINFLSCTQCKHDVNVDFNVIADPMMAINFTTNYNDIAVLEARKILDHHPGKTKLFSSLVRRLNVSRVMMTAAAMSNFKEKDYILSAGIGDYTKEIPNRKNFYNRMALTFGAGLNFLDKLPIRYDDVDLSTVDIDTPQYKMYDPRLSECLFDIVHETVSGNDIFMEDSVTMTDNFFSYTEKSFRHVFNYQLPLFIAPPNFYKVFLNTFELEPPVMVQWETLDSISNYYDKVTATVEFLKKVKKDRNYDVIFDKNKDIMLHNFLTLQRHNTNRHLFDKDMAIDAISPYWSPKKLLRQKQISIQADVRLRANYRPWKKVII